jgi:hypothetical protein
MVQEIDLDIPFPENVNTPEDFDRLTKSVETN